MPKTTNKRSRGRKTSTKDENHPGKGFRYIPKAKDPLKGLMARYALLNPVSVRRELLRSGAIVESVSLDGKSWLGPSQLEPLLEVAKVNETLNVIRGRITKRLDKCLSRSVLEATSMVQIQAEFSQEEWSLLSLSAKAWRIQCARQESGSEDSQSEEA